MSVIPVPLTTNYIFQICASTLTSNTTILEEGVTPLTKIFVQLRNSNYYDFSQNSFKYMFVYTCSLSNFVNCRPENCEVISQDQLRLNYQTDLVRPNGKTLVLKNCVNDPALARKYSVQYGIDGLNMGDYVRLSSIPALSTIMSECPVDMQGVPMYCPQIYVAKYIRLDPDGKKTEKTSNICAIKYMGQDKKPKVIFFGSGLQEFIIV